MFFRNVLLISFLILNNKAAVLKREKTNIEMPAVIKIYNAPLNENLDMYISLNVNPQIFNNFFNFTITYNNTVQKYRILGTRIAKYNFVLESFKKGEGAKDLNILIELETTANYLYTNATLQIKAPENGRRIAVNNLTTYSGTPVYYEYTTNTKTYKYIYENLEFICNHNINLTGTRIIDLSNIGFKFTSLDTYTLPNVVQGAFLIYSKIDTDVAYVSGYHKFTFDLINRNGIYYFDDIYKFYVHRITGGIYTKNTLDTGNILYPLFIPLSFGYNKTLSYRLEISNIGINNNTYQKSGYIILDSLENSSLGFYYYESYNIHQSVQYGDYNG